MEGGSVGRRSSAIPNHGRYEVRFDLAASRSRICTLMRRPAMSLNPTTMTTAVTVPTVPPMATPAARATVTTADVTAKMRPRLLLDSSRTMRSEVNDDP